MQRNLISGRPATAVVIALVASVAIAACGGSGSSGSSAASATSAGLRFAACVRAHGVPDFPDSGSIGTGQTATNGGGQTATNGTGQTKTPPPGKVSIDGHILSESSQVVLTAYSKCQKYSPVTNGPRYSTAQLAKIQTAALAMSKCMRANGVPNYPDEKVAAGPGGHGFEIGAPGDYLDGHPLDATAPAFRAANIKCSALLNRAVPGKKG